MTVGRIPSVEGGIQPTLLTTKGDIIVATGNATLVRQGVGTDGQVLTADSTQADGIIWATPSAGMTNPLTTTGDTIYSSSGSTPARRAIGTTGQVLTVSGGVPTWATPTVSGTWSQVATGSLTGATITVSSLSGASYYIILRNAGNDGGSGSPWYLRFNGDSGANYASIQDSAYQNQLPMSPNFQSTRYYSAYVDLANTASPNKPAYAIGTTGSATGGIWNSTAAITSITFGIVNASSWNTGTYFVWSKS
jgi:hypothetical protein